MKIKLIFLLLCFLSCSIQAGGEKTVNDIATPSPVQLAWQQAELGVVFHYDLHIFDDKHYYQPRNRVTPCADINAFNPVKLDTDQWVRTAKAMGARFAILTASHETGFRLWQSDANPYSLKSVKWGDGKRDIVAEFIASCKKYGIKPGIYMGTRWNSQLGVYDFKVTERSSITQKDYNKLIEDEVEEICSRYGDLFELWFDGGAYGPKDGGPDVLSIFEKYQPNCLFYHNYQRADSRWGGSESGTVPYPCWATMPFADGWAGRSKLTHANNFHLLKVGDPDGKYWCPAMSDAPLRSHEWFWDEGDDKKVKSLSAMLNMYYSSVGRNSTLIVGLTPDNRGLMPDVDVKRCQELGKALRKIFSKELASVSGKGNSLELKLPANLSFDHIVIQEDIKYGELIRKFKVESFSEGRWTEINNGSCIGHKRIVKLAEPVIADRLRLTISESIAEPVIKNFAVYDLLNPKKDSKSSVGDSISVSFADKLKYIGIAIKDKGWHIWGSSPIIADDGKVHIFAARWSNNVSFEHGWRQYSQIAHYVADSPEGPFKFSDVALEGSGKDTWDRYSPSNPVIAKVDGKYVLVYIGNSIGVTKGFPAHPPTQRIGIATSDSPYGPWKKIGKDGLILSPSDDPKHWTYKAGNGVVNPAFLQQPDGSFFLYYKSQGSKMGLAIADKLAGPYVHQPDPVTNNKVAIEDDYAFVMDGEIRLLTTDNHGILKRGGGLLWTSEDQGYTFAPDPVAGFGLMREYISAEHWTNPKTYYGQGGKFERPQVLMINSKPAYIYMPGGTNIQGDGGTVSYIFRVCENFF
ncbi:MAG: alpha-L-fucosidase [Phycisphaerae bacterium]|nr:alpha-L-fucosidase [Phycisphaerae bacterium]